MGHASSVRLFRLSNSSASGADTHFLSRRLKLPITYHKQEQRPAWFDIKSFPWNGIEDSDEDHYFASTRALNMIIREERDRLIKAERRRQGGDSNSPVTKEEQEWASKRILIGGFSQGGVMSLLTGLTHENKLGGIVVFSGMLPVRHLLPEVSFRIQILLFDQRC